MKMNQEVKALWIEALRSGRYSQATGILVDEDGKMCCIGVLRDIIDPGCTYDNEKTSYLNYQHQLKAGLDSADSDTLARKNDDGETFEEIANYIEAKL